MFGKLICASVGPFIPSTFVNRRLLGWRGTFPFVGTCNVRLIEATPMRVRPRASLDKLVRGSDERNGLPLICRRYGERLVLLLTLTSAETG